MILLSAALYSYNKIIDEKSRSYSDSITEKIEEHIEKDHELKDITDKEIPTITIDKKKYIGILEIPKIKIKLPVSREYAYEQMSKSLCLYKGSFEKNNVIICGHNYEHFLNDLKDVFDEDTVYFIDVYGNKTEYTVSETYYIGGYEGLKLEANSQDWDMTIFTCNYIGNMRYVVRCRKTQPE